MLIQLFAWVGSFRVTWSKKLSNKLYNFLYWGGILRLLMEGFLEVIIATMLNVRRNYWDATYSIIMTNVFSTSMTLILVLLPVWILVFYCKKREEWANEEFEETYGAVLEGLELRPTKPMTDEELAALSEEEMKELFNKA